MEKPTSLCNLLTITRHLPSEPESDQYINYHLYVIIRYTYTLFHYEKLFILSCFSLNTNCRRLYSILVQLMRKLK